MEQKNTTDLVMSANSLKSALDGLTSFIFYNVSSDEVKLDDISALDGIVQAIRALAANHAQDLQDLVEFEDEYAKKNIYINGQSIFETKE